MVNKKSPIGKFFPLTLITLICLVVLWQCSGNSGHDHDKKDDDKQEQTQENSEKETPMEMETSPEEGEMLEEGDNESLRFEDGTTASKIQAYLETGSGETSFVLDKVIAYDDNDIISEDQKKQLDNLAALLKAYPDKKIEVRGHSRAGDGVAEKTANKASSKGRALWVQGKLANRGVPGSQMKARGIGGAEPLEGVDPKDMSQRRISISFVTEEE